MNRADWSELARFCGKLTVIYAQHRCGVVAGDAMKVYGSAAWKDTRA